MTPLLTVKQVAELLQVSTSWVYARVQKDLPCVFIGGLVRLEADAVRAWVAAQRKEC